MPLRAILALLASAWLILPPMSAQPVPVSPENARILAAGGCVLLDGTPTHPFAGLLVEGECYRAEFVFAKGGAIRLKHPLRLPAHHAGRIEWTNRRDLPRLLRSAATPSPQLVVFRVLSKKVEKAGDTPRWNTTYRCRIDQID